LTPSTARSLPTTAASPHAAAPLFDALRAFVERGQAPFYSPGHKGGRTLDPWFRTHIAELDLNNLPDTDTLHCPTGGIALAERLIADAWGAGESFILVQGSTLGNIAMALAGLRPGDRVLVQRNAHKSVVAGLVQSGAVPVWLQPRWDARFGLAHGVDAAAVDAALAAQPARAVWLLHPTYFGTVADLAAIVAVCRRHGALLFVDGAHSPHFAFHPDLPPAAEQLGAAAVVQSVHKIISGLSQAAVLHIDPAQLDPQAVRRALQLAQTTSPHFAIMASIDLARREMALHGRELLDGALTLARQARRRLREIPGLNVLGQEDAFGPGSGFAMLDETKLVVGVRNLGIDGRIVVAELNRAHGVQPEFGAADHVLCILTIGNTQADVDRLVAGFAAIAAKAPGRPARSDDALARDLLAALPEIVLTPRDAFFAANEAVSLDAAIGRVAAEAITPYPPGIPAIMPGERLTAGIVALLRAALDNGTPVSAADPQLKTVKVVT